MVKDILNCLQEQITTLNFKYLSALPLGIVQSPGFNLTIRYDKCSKVIVSK